MENQFEGDLYNRALIYSKMATEEQEEFRKLPVQTQINLLRVPLKKQNSIKKGNLDTYIAWYALSNKERKDIKNETRRQKNAKDAEKYKKLTAMKIADRNYY